MLDQTIRQTILTLRDAGQGIRAIARALGVSRVAVKRVLAGGQASPPQLERAERAEPYRDEILALYAECKGNLVRVHEELVARQLVMLSYPALTAFCRKHGIGHEPAKPAGRYPFAPGKEMQHDTSPHDAHIGGALRADCLAGAVPLAPAVLSVLSAVHPVRVQAVPARRRPVRRRYVRGLHGR
jgi:predicted transcriptional regulator